MVGLGGCGVKAGLMNPGHRTEAPCYNPGMGATYL